MIYFGSLQSVCIRLMRNLCNLIPWRAVVGQEFFLGKITVPCNDNDVMRSPCLTHISNLVPIGDRVFVFLLPKSLHYPVRYTRISNSVSKIVILDKLTTSGDLKGEVNGSLMPIGCQDCPARQVSVHAGHKYLSCETLDKPNLMM